MEQRPIIPPVHAAGTDPAFIPGLTPPPPAGTEETAPEQVGEQAPEGGDPDESEPAAEGDVVEERDDEESEEAEAGEDEVEGPAFEASDRRGAIIANRKGVTFRLDGETADFGWDEIGAVEIDSPRFGRQFGVTVYVSSRRWYEAEVQAPARKLLKTWTAELDEVLDAFFEEAKGGEEPEGGDHEENEE